MVKMSRILDLFPILIILMIIVIIGSCTAYSIHLDDKINAERSYHNTMIGGTITITPPANESRTIEYYGPYSLHEKRYPSLFGNKIMYRVIKYNDKNGKNYTIEVPMNYMLEINPIYK